MKKRHAGLAYENGSSPANLLSLLRLVEEYNKYDQTVTPCF
jgi:hypothetical protein